MSHHKTCECDACECEGDDDGIVWVFLGVLFLGGALVHWAVQEVGSWLNL